MPLTERRTFAEERQAFAKRKGTELGEPFDVSAPPSSLVDAMMRRLGLS